MSAMTDLDRVLGAWLEEGPSRAPDHPIDVALEHARSHPRRRDPFLFLRSDPMGRRSVGFGARPVMVLAMLGLLLAAVVAVGVGSNQQRSVDGPAPSGNPSPSTPASPSQSPRPSFGLVGLLDDFDTGPTVRIDDASGRVVGVEPVAPGDVGPDPNAEIPAGGVLIQNEEPTTLRLTWAGGGCPTAYVLAIDAAGRSMIVTGAPCSGDAVGVARVLRLRFDGPVEASTVTASLVE